MIQHFLPWVQMVPSTEEELMALAQDDRNRCVHADNGEFLVILGVPKKQMSTSERSGLERRVAQLEDRLENIEFRSKAPASVVDHVITELQELRRRLI